MRFPRTWLVAAGVLLAAAACSSGGSSTGSSTVSPTSQPAQPTQSGQPIATSSPDGTAPLSFFDNPVTIGAHPVRQPPAVRHRRPTRPGRRVRGLDPGHSVVHQ